MALIALQPQLLGQWAGEKQLWLAPNDPPLISPSTLIASTAALGKFLCLSYSWAYSGKPQQGLLLVGDENGQSTASAAWVDSWHQSGSVMHCLGSSHARGFSVLGHYAAPPGPDWGWRCSLELTADELLQFEMHNVQPGEAEQLAVRAIYRRT